MNRPFFAIAAAALTLLAGGAAKADYWRYDDDWRWHHHHHHYRPWSREVIIVQPAPVVRYAQPQTVYVMPPPAPIQATPTSPPFTDGLGRYCREYQSTVSVGGMQQPSYGTACLMPDGSWRIVD